MKPPGYYAQLDSENVFQAYVRSFYFDCHEIVLKVVGQSNPGLYLESFMDLFWSYA